MAINKVMADKIASPKENKLNQPWIGDLPPNTHEIIKNKIMKILNKEVEIANKLINLAILPPNLITPSSAIECFFA